MSVRSASEPNACSRAFFGGWTHFAGELARFLEKDA